jgi:preprotein translocase subunit Sec63
MILIVHWSCRRSLSFTNKFSTKFSIVSNYGVINKDCFRLVTLNRILNRITEVTSGCWWLVVVNAIPISDICQINQQNISSYNVINKNFLNCIANLNSPS